MFFPCLNQCLEFSEGPDQQLCLQLRATLERCNDLILQNDLLFKKIKIMLYVMEIFFKYIDFLLEKEDLPFLRI